MSAGYRAIAWSPQKKAYDRALFALLGGYLALFLGGTALLRPETTIETALLRALGSAAFLLLHVVLSIGPLCRLAPRLLPLLHNRRHLGVTTFLVAAAHGALALVQFHAGGNADPLASLLAGAGGHGSIAQFPFQQLGFAALGILFLLASTSHDFWLANLTAPVWKALHQAVYVAYALVVAHVGLGILQDEPSPWLAAAVFAGASWIFGLHGLAAWRERSVDRPGREILDDDGWADAGPAADIPVDRARIVNLGGERVAVFRHGGRSFSALSNVCQHQNGPLGEGRIVDGCVTCPWHGYQYRPEDGASPPPFTEKVPTFRVRVRAGRVWIDPRPLPAGTRVEPARWQDGEDA